MDDSGVSTPLWDNVFHADYVILQNEFGAKKFETFMTTPYPKVRLIWDEIDWPEFWKDAAGVTGTVLFAWGLAVSSELLVVSGVVIGGAVVLIDVTDIVIHDLIPIVQEIKAGNDPADIQIREFNEAIKYVTEQNIEQVIEELTKLKIPIFDIKGLWQNVGNAIKYTP